MCHTLEELLVRGLHRRGGPAPSVPPTGGRPGASGGVVGPAQGVVDGRLAIGRSPVVTRSIDVRQGGQGRGAPRARSTRCPHGRSAGRWLALARARRPPRRGQLGDPPITVRAPRADARGAVLGAALRRRVQGGRVLEAARRCRGDGGRCGPAAGPAWRLGRHHVRRDGRRAGAARSGRRCRPRRRARAVDGAAPPAGPATAARVPPRSCAPTRSSRWPTGRGPPMPVACDPDR